MRLMHFDLTGERIIFRTYSPSLDDYDAKTSAAPNAGNSYVVAGADSSINGEENFELSFQDLGIEWKTKSLITKNLDVNVYGQEVIGTVDDVESGMPASLTWKDAPEGDNGWYAEITDENGGLTRTLVQYVTIARDHNAPVLNLPDQNTLTVGQRFDPMEGVSASDVEDGDLTGSVQVTGTVDAKKPGTYELTYEVSDSSGNKTVKKRVVAVTGTENQSSNEGNQSEEDKKADTSVKTGDEARLEILWPLSLLSAALSLFVIRREGKKKRDR